MEFISILAEMMLESVRMLPSREIDEKKLRVYCSILLTIAMILGVGLSSYFLIDSFRAGLLLKFYLWVGLGINALTALSVGLIIPQLWIWKADTYIQESEELLRSELHSLIDLFLFSLIPGFHIIFLPRVVDKAKRLIECAGHTPETRRYGKIAGNLITISALLILTYTLIFGIGLIIAGDTRRAH
jgi:hypothetical protein